LNKWMLFWFITLTGCTTTTYSASTESAGHRTPCRTIESCRVAVDDAHDQLMACPSCPGLREDYKAAQRELAVVTQHENSTANERIVAGGNDKMAALRAEEEERRRLLAEDIEARRQVAEERARERQQREDEEQRARDDARAQAEAQEAELEAKMNEPQFGSLVLAEKFCGTEEDLHNLRKQLAEMKTTNRRSGTIRPADQRDLVERIEDTERQAARYKAALKERFGQAPKSCAGTWRKQLDACLAEVQYEHSEAGPCDEPYSTAFELLRAGFGSELLAAE
jgi:hypothetical protein